MFFPTSLPSTFPFWSASFHPPLGLKWNFNLLVESFSFLLIPFDFLMVFFLECQAPVGPFFRCKNVGPMHSYVFFYALQKAQKELHSWLIGGSLVEVL